MTTGRPLIEFLGIPEEETAMSLNGWHEPHALDARERPTPSGRRDGVRSAAIAAPPREIDHGSADVTEAYLDVEAEPVSAAVVDAAASADPQQAELTDDEFVSDGDSPPTRRRRPKAPTW